MKSGQCVFRRIALIYVIAMIQSHGLPETVTTVYNPGMLLDNVGD